ncbi:MuDRA-like transposase [Cucumis melo var. makuwa]|uniref:MuDRA-like transposase n=1 Tax=Cucumis melo var. makuwa TaxID=1194695 RepID=A0A5A7V3V7_CUCMM|nr:MuDRA-like transposase [Cucumis melo var. makuwa]TYK06248.1 MuDRA-like transposase [Cucumis melo var. makuwa]
MHKDLQYELYDLAEVDPIKFDIKIRCIYEIKGEKEAPPFELSNDRDLKFYILSENSLEVPLYLSFEPTSNRSMRVLNKDYNSVSGSNQVQNLNPHPPIGMETLDENEVDIGEVQVDLFDNMIGKYLNDVGIARWSRVHYPGRRYNMMTTNIAESMNSILKEPRDLSIASFLEHVRALLQHWFWERREEGIKVTSTLTKWAKLVIQKKQEGALTMKTKECTCKEFQAEQLPCSHAIAAARDCNAYAEAVYPVGNQSDWKTSEDYVHMTVLPPKVVKRVGRPKKKRIPTVGEAPKLHKCGRCKEIDGSRRRK